MILKTVSGPSIRDALADARRLFGDDVVMLQSSPAAHGQAASVTVAFDSVPALDEAPPPVRRRALPAAPEPGEVPAPRAYGYGGARNGRPAPTEPLSTPVRSASAAEVAELRARLAEMEATLAELRTAAPPAPRRAPLVFVGPSGSGKTSLALRLAQAPHLVGAPTVAVVIVAPETDSYIDPTPVFWGAGVPVAAVRTPDEVRDALVTFADADLLLVDTPSLPLHPDRARPVVSRLGEMLAPLADVEVALVVDATRAPSTLSADAIAALGLRPDALALTRLDEASPESWRWGPHLGLSIRLAASGPDVTDLSTEVPTPEASQPADVPAPAEEPAASVATVPVERPTSRPDSILTPVDLSDLFLPPPVGASPRPVLA